MAFKQQRNIREEIVRAKVAPERQTRGKQTFNGMKKCGKCQVCSYVVEGNFVKAENSH